MNRLEEILKQRKIRGITWEQLAENLPIGGNSLRLAFSRGKVNPYYLEVIEKDLGIEKTEQNVVTEPEPVFENTSGNKYKELSDGSYDVEVEVIPFSAYASYLESMETGLVEEDFETTVFKVDKIGLGNYKAFVVRGDSMNGGGINDTKDGATVLGRELGRHHWKDGFYPTDYGWIILSKQNIFHKDIVDYDPDTGEITCHSRNPSPEFADFKLHLNDVYQIFKVIKRIF